MRYFGAFESCALFLYKWKTSVTQIVRYTPTHTHAHARTRTHAHTHTRTYAHTHIRTHAHGEMEASVPLLPFYLGE